ncbi:MAG: four helix bundle protein [Candidatus Pacebacteria bacterium]|nr:four helix bundle protein [Candidatus Paceibacterota bacterium]
MKSTPPPRILPVLQKLKTVYIQWYGYLQTIPKPHRHSLGLRIDTLFVESMEAISVASFLQRKEKLPWVKLAIRKIDTAKVLLMVLWETKSLDSKKYIELSVQLEEIGKMLGGWNGQISSRLLKQNSPTMKAGEK